MSRLQGKTGASSGIGEACAKEFANNGCNLVLAARRIERLSLLREEILQNHSKIDIHICKVDVRDRPAVFECVSKLPVSHVDILINNAGLASGLGPLENAEESSIDQMFDTNVKGLINVTQAILPLMRVRPDVTTTIINIGSIAGKQAYPNGAVYCASKHAVHGLSQAFRMEMAMGNSRIRVAEVNPGLVETEFSMVRFEGDEERAKKVYEGMTPLTGQDIAEIVTFIASRPDHVQISELDCFPINQASAYHVSRQ